MEYILQVVLITVLLLTAGVLVLLKTGRDYHRIGRLTASSSILQLMLFVLHAIVSLVLLESRISTIDTRSPLFGLALLLIVGGLIMLVATLGRLGIRRTIGHDTSGLTCSGMYRRSRNPQVLSYGIVVLGYSLLWPSWTGVLWVVLYAALAQMMVRTEEKHLRRMYGDDYVTYCQLTPRYMDLPGMK